MTATKARPKEVWIGLWGTPDEQGWYPVTPQSRFNQLFVFIRKFSIGDATRDSDEYISSWISGDWTGGGQVEDLNEGAEASRFWIAFADTRSPNQATLPPLVTAVRPNSSCTSTMPLQVGNDGVMYHAFNESGTWKVWGFNETSQAFDYNGGTGVALGGEPKGHAIQFDGVIYVPLGSSGYTRITGSAGTPTCTNVAGSADPTTASPTSAPRPVAFCLYDEKLWGITGEGGIANHSIANKDAGSNTWNWPYGISTTDFPHIEASATPLALIVFPDKAGAERIHVKTTRGVRIFDDNTPRFITTDIIFPPHPDINYAAAIFRPGENMMLGMGLDMWRYTSANVVVPLSGLARDAGLPQEYRGTIKDLAAEISCLYAIVGGVLDVSSGWTYNDTVGSSGSGNGQFADVLDVVVLNDGKVAVTDEENHRVQIFDAALTYSSQFGSSGSGNGQFNLPNGIDTDSAGNIYVADFGNNRIQKFNSSGTYQAKSGTITGVAGLCIDATDRLFATQTTGGTSYLVCYDTSLVVQWFVSVGAGGNAARHIDTDGTYVYVVKDATVQRRLCTDGSLVSSWGGSGSADGQFGSPNGISVNPVTGNVVVSDNTRDDIQEFTNTGVFVRKIGSTGSGNGQFTYPYGLAFSADGETLFATDVDNEDVQAFIGETAGQLNAYPTLHAWTGTGWHGLWKGTTSANVPTMMTVASATNGYKLWWGMDDGYARFITLRRTLHNPRQGFLAGVDTFAPTGEIITGWFDAAMTGFDKLAVRAVANAKNATATETITVEFAIDDGGWESLGTVTSTGETNLPIGVSDGFRRGRRFNKIRFRLTLARGSSNLLTPVLDSIILHFSKVPQNTTSHTLEIPLTRKHNGRTPAEMYDDLTALVTAGELVQLVIGRDTTSSAGIVKSAVRSCLPSQISGIEVSGTGMQRHITLTLVEVP